MKPRIFFTVLFILCLLFVLSISLIFTSNSNFVWGRAIMVGVLFFMVVLALFNNFLTTSGENDPWHKLAMRTGLTCRTVGAWLGYPMHLVGTYRDHPLTLYIQKRSRFMPSFTRIELNIKNHADTYLRLRGPYESNEITFDQTISNFFGARHYRIGNQEFFIRSDPENLASNLFASISPSRKQLRDQFFRLERGVNIEVDGSKLFFEQVGIIKDIEYLQYLFNLLSDLADAVERSSGWVRV